MGEKWNRYQKLEGFCLSPTEIYFVNAKENNPDFWNLVFPKIKEKQEHLLFEHLRRCQFLDVEAPFQVWLFLAELCSFQPWPCYIVFEPKDREDGCAEGEVETCCLPLLSSAVFCPGSTECGLQQIQTD